MYPGTVQYIFPFSSSQLMRINAYHRDQTFQQASQVKPAGWLEWSLIRCLLEA
ncbi:predicted protein [Pyrenophora tritici-repentis Pt-1C-BFP]|uniref:Uncharacterized protein n=1 Tax=Pyrenophora tritici-repentis (strain Pt-1C-BFP) TaxID=426418 RepID=B2WDL2_PYRTR|nr:uncharacterized protein PTRG_08071 [Pyrenophora tritici-repentis Pt-1C-BFP]EDU50990.1 predicted protein [Pyrenophora tritici-repentis Pt-1C-BFP]